MEKIFYEDLGNFMTHDRYKKFFPSPTMTFAEQLNSLMRLAIYFALIMFFVKRDPNIFLAPLITAASSFVLYSMDQKNKLNEKNTLEKMGLRQQRGQVCQEPTKDNPFMNVLISDYKERPQRPKACRFEGHIKNEVAKNFENNLYRDVDDIYQKNSSDRQYYTMPGTSIPNESVNFANWLYGNVNKTCKEGSGRQCYANLYK